MQKGNKKTGKHWLNRYSLVELRLKSFSSCQLLKMVMTQPGFSLYLETIYEYLQVVGKFPPNNGN